MTVTPCPGCGGPHMPSHPLGPVIFRHAIGCEHLRADDQTRVTDDCYGAPFTRAATPTERLLLAALGHDVPANLTTRVEPTPIGARRTWPQLTSG